MKLYASILIISKRVVIALSIECELFILCACIFNALRCADMQFVLLQLNCSECVSRWCVHLLVGVWYFKANLMFQSGSVTLFCVKKARLRKCGF